MLILDVDNCCCAMMYNSLCST